MKIKVDQKVLSTALQLVGCIHKPNTQVYSSHVMFKLRSGKIVLSVFSEFGDIMVPLDCQFFGFSEGSGFGLDYSRLSKLVKFYTGNLEFSIEKSSCNFRSSKSVNRIPVLEVSHFPNLPISGETLFQVELSFLLSSIKRVYLVDSNSDNPMWALKNAHVSYRGVNSQLTIQCCDGKNFAISSIQVETEGMPDDREIMLPLASLGVIQKIASSKSKKVSFKFSENSLVLISPEFVLRLRLSTGKFPDITKISLFSNRSFTVNSDDFLVALNRAQIFSKPNSGLVLNILENEISVETQDSEIGYSSQELPCVSGIREQISIFPSFLSKILPNLGSQVKVEFSDRRHDPVKFSNAELDESYYYLTSRVTSNE